MLAPLDNYEHVLWASQVYIPLNELDSKDKFGIFHCVHDEGHDRLYFTLTNPHRGNIYYIDFADVVPDEKDFFMFSASTKSKSLKHIELKVFTPNSVTGDRQFWGMAVDQERRLLYAGSTKDITVWSLDIQDPTNANEIGTMLIDSIACDDIVDCSPVEPRYLAFTTVGIPKLAIADYLNNKVCTFFFEKETFPQSRPEKLFVPNIEAKVLVAYKTNEQMPADLGSVYGPCELTFDSTGNVLVAEASNKRIQIFSFRRDNKVREQQQMVQYTSRCNWTSDRIDGGAYRLNIVRGIVPMMVVAQQGRADVLCFQ